MFVQGIKLVQQQRVVGRDVCHMQPLVDVQLVKRIKSRGPS